FWHNKSDRENARNSQAQARAQARAAGSMSAPSPKGPAPRFSLAGPLAWFAATWTVVTTVACVIAASCDLPYADEWDLWMSWLRQGYSLGWFFGLHNDHRIATTRLVFAVSHELFAGRIWFPQVTSLLVQALLVVLLWRLAIRSKSGDRLDSAVMGAALACCLFSAQQAVNFFWGFQVQFFLVYATGAASL